MNKKYYAGGLYFDLTKITPTSSADIDVSKLERQYSYQHIPYEGDENLTSLLDFLNLYKDDPEISSFQIENDDSSWGDGQTINLIKVSTENDAEYALRQKATQATVFQYWLKYQAELNKAKLTSEQKKMVRLEALAKELGVKIEK